MMLLWRRLGHPAWLTTNKANRLFLSTAAFCCPSQSAENGANMRFQLRTQRGLEPLLKTALMQYLFSSRFNVAHHSYPTLTAICGTGEVTLEVDCHHRMGVDRGPLDLPEMLLRCARAGGAMVESIAFSLVELNIINKASLTDDICDAIMGVPWQGNVGDTSFLLCLFRSNVFQHSDSVDL